MKLPTVLVYFLALAGSFTIKVTNVKSALATAATTHFKMTNETTVSPMKTTTMPSIVGTINETTPTNAPAMTPTIHTPPEVPNVPSAVTTNDTTTKPLDNNTTTMPPNTTSTPMMNASSKRLNTTTAKMPPNTNTTNAMPLNNPSIVPLITGIPSLPVNATLVMSSSTTMTANGSIPMLTPNSTTANPWRLTPSESTMAPGNDVTTAIPSGMTTTTLKHYNTTVVSSKTTMVPTTTRSSSSDVHPNLFICSLQVLLYLLWK